VKRKRDARPGNYDVCLSFAGEDRAYVRRVAHLLRGKGVRVFFDEYAQADMGEKTCIPTSTTCTRTLLATVSCSRRDITRGRSGRITSARVPRRGQCACTPSTCSRPGSTEPTYLV